MAGESHSGNPLKVLFDNLTWILPLLGGEQIVGWFVDIPHSSWKVGMVLVMLGPIFYSFTGGWPRIMRVVAKLPRLKLAWPGQVEEPRTARRASLIIHSAVYGTGPENDIDVRDVFENTVSGDALVIAVNNDVLCGPGKDPAFGKVKRLEIEYSYDGQVAKKRASRPEHSRLVLPEDTYLLEEISRLSAGSAASPSEIDRLRAALEETQQDRERIRGLLGGAEVARSECRRDFAHARLEWVAERFKRNIENHRKEGGIVQDIHVTVRFAVYSDFPLAQRVSEIVTKYTGWPVELDGSNKPTLLPDSNGFKVIFDVGGMQTYDEVAFAFSSGELLGADVRVGRRISDRFNSELLIVEILPAMP